MDAHPTTSRTRTAPEADGTLGGVLFDMDGTLVDTEPMWHRAQVEILAEYGATWTEEQSLDLIGKPVDHAARTLVETSGVPLTWQQMLERMIRGVLDLEAAEGLPWRPGALELIGALGRASVPCAIVTSSYRTLTTEVAAQVRAALAEHDAAHLLVGVIAAEDVDRHKPHPEPYLAGAALVGRAPSDCVAIEDSPSGVRAALDAGCRTLGIPVNLELPPEPGLNRARSLEQVDLPVLEAMASGQVLDLLTD